MKLQKTDGIPFTQISNDILNSKTLTLKAKGLYCFMYSKKNNWNFTITSMAKNLKEGRDAIMKALQELKDQGWIYYTRTTSGKGIYTIHWSQTPVNKPQSEKPDLGFPTVGKSDCIRKTIPLRKTVNTKRCFSDFPSAGEELLELFRENYPFLRNWSGGSDKRFLLLPVVKQELCIEYSSFENPPYSGSILGIIETMPIEKVESELQTGSTRVWN